MLSLSLAFVFIIELALGLGLFWLWTSVRERMKAMEEKIAESLDDQDLMDFQERVSGLLAEIKQAGSSTISKIDESRSGLERQLARAADGEKRLASKAEALDKASEKSKAKIGDWILKLGNKASQAKAAPQPQAPKPAPAKVSYLRPSAKAKPPFAPAATRHLKVYEMADQGFSRQEIAKACGYLSGEVELILNLRPNPGA